MLDPICDLFSFNKRLKANFSAVTSLFGNLLAKRGVVDTFSEAEAGLENSFTAKVRVPYFGRN